MSETVTEAEPESYSVEEEQIAHLAGVFDAVGGITVNVIHDTDYRLDYTIQPMLRLLRPDENDPLLGKLMAYCDENAIKYSISEKSHGEERESTSVEWLVKNPESIRQFLEPMLPYLVTQYEKAVVMLEQIVPRIEDGLHREKSGFLEIMEFADMIRQSNRRGTELKYTREYFEDEWSITQ